MTTKIDIWIIIAAVLITAPIVGSGVYLWQRAVLEREKQEITQVLKDQIDALKNQIAQLELEDEGQGAEGPGLPGIQPASKYCEDREAPQEEVFGEVLTITPDRKTILLNNKVAVSIEDLPTTILVSPDSSFGVENEAFTSAVLSPTKSIIAFTVSGGIHEWGGFRNVFSGLVYPVAFQFEGTISNPKWNRDGRYVAFSKRTSKPADVLALVDARELKTYTSEYEEVLDFTDRNPLPSGILSNLRNHYWSENKDNKLYFLVALLDSAVNIEHAELWFVEANTLKWDFYCTAY